MIIAVSILAVLAAVLHVYIFVMESITWTSQRTRVRFGLSADEAAATKAMAFNQGFLNRPGLSAASIRGAALG